MSLLESLTSTIVGTIAYWPPERFQADMTVNENEFRYDVRSDIWSLGVTIAETAYGRLPFIASANESVTGGENDLQGMVNMRHCIMNVDTNELVGRCLADNKGRALYADDFHKFVLACLEPLDNRPRYEVLKTKPFYLRYSGVVNEARMAEYLNQYNVSSGVFKSP